jgi:hypothetical protein
MNSPRSRPTSRLLLVLAAVAAVVFGLVAPASAAAPYCGITWGSLLKEASGPAGPGAAPTLTGVRSGHHDCFDRLVVDVAGNPGAGYRVEYGDVRQEGRGDPVPLRGAADLRVILFADGSMLGNDSELVSTAGLPTLLQVASAGFFEGQTTLGLGVRGHLPFRVFTLAGPGSGGRIVIDVAHAW